MFCVRCAEKEAQIELLITKFYTEIETLKARLDKVETENDKLTLDLAFYSGSIPNLTPKVK